MLKARVFSHLSSPLFLVILTLMGVGLVQVYSSSYVFATESYGDGLYFFMRQLSFVLIGFFVILFSASIPTEWIEKWSWSLWLIAGLGVGLTFIGGIGVKAGGAHRCFIQPGDRQGNQISSMTTSYSNTGTEFRQL